MPTRQEVLTAIETINDNGNNTAQEVRTVLTALMDYTENDTAIQNNLETFHYWDEGVPLEDRRGGRLWYSFRGYSDRGDGETGAKVNFTFRLLIRESGLNDPAFQVPEEVFKMLTEVVEVEESLTFAVPMQHPQFNLSAVVPLRLVLKAPNQLGMIIETEDRLLDQHSIFTSISFHSPKFDF
jgi:hypothetical protein